MRVFKRKGGRIIYTQYQNGFAYVGTRFSDFRLGRKRYNPCYDEVLV